ncbi:MAG: DUF2760 domain-containing protein [Chlamydiota bacterium]
MSLMTAFKAFFKALKNPKKAKQFLEEQPVVKKEKTDPSHLRLLNLLQDSGRLVDFLKEDISKFNDAQVGAAVRKIHSDCNKSLEEYVTIRPIMEEEEGQNVAISEGYDPANIKIVGKVKGQPPFKGKLIHKGWRAHKRSLPKQVGDLSTEVIQPAEVEIK